MANSKTREQYPLSYKKVMKKTISSLFAWFFFLVVFGVIIGVIFATDTNLAAYISTLVVGSIVLFVIAGIISYVYQTLYFNTYFYDLTDHFIIIKKGVIMPREINMPYERIQDVYVDQDLLDRVFGIYDVHLSTATIASGMHAHIDGLEKNAAEGMRDQLLHTLHEKISRKTQNSTATTPKAE